MLRPEPPDGSFGSIRMRYDGDGRSRIVSEEEAGRLHRRREAELIAAELHRAAVNGEPCRMAKMTALLHAFRDSSGTPVEVAAVTEVLGTLDVVLKDAGGSTLDRASVVELSPESPDQTSADAQAQPILGTCWKPGHAPSDLADGVHGDVVWVDIPPDMDRDDLKSQLAGVCGDIPAQVLDDLLDRPAEATTRNHGDGPEAMRALSMFAAISFVDVGQDRRVALPGLNLLVGNGWLLTFWHAEAEAPTLLRRPFVSRVTRAWLGEAPYDADIQRQTAGDLALALMSAAVDTYDATQRTLEDWSGQTEAALLRLLAVTPGRSMGGDERGRHETELLGDVGWLLATSGALKRSLSALQRARSNNYDGAWFPRVTGHHRSRHDDGPIARVDEMLSTSVEHLDAVHRDVRGLLELAQIHFDAERQRHNERMDGVVRTVTAVVLVPTLIAATYGANVDLPGGSSWIGTAIMALLMVFGGVVTYLYLGWVARRT